MARLGERRERPNDDCFIRLSGKLGESLHCPDHGRSRAVTIKNARVDRPLEELVALTGDSTTMAIVRSLEERRSLVTERGEQSASSSGEVKRHRGGKHATVSGKKMLDSGYHAGAGSLPPTQQRIPCRRMAMICASRNIDFHIGRSG